MSSKFTEYHNLDLYEPDSVPNLLDEYNGAMHKVDLAIHKNVVDIVAANERSNEAISKANKNATAIEKINDEKEAFKTEINANISSVNNKATANESQISAIAERVTANATKIGQHDVALMQLNSNVTTEVAKLKSAAFKEVTNSISTTDENLPTSKAVADAIANAKPKGRNLVLTFGDSYADTPINYNSWSYQLGQISQYEIKSFAVSGAGFRVDTRTFDAQLTRAINDHSYNKDDVKCLVLGGGRNDILTYEEAYSLTKAWAEKAVEAFPNARVLVAPMLYDSSGMGATGYRKAGGMCNGARDGGATVINYAWCWLRGKDDCILGGGDIHPNKQGAKILAHYFLDAINGCYVPRSDYWYGNWNGAEVFISASCATVNIQVQGTMSGTYKDLTFPKKFAPVSDACSYIYTGAGNNPTILFVKSNGTMSIFNASGSVGGMGGTISVAW